MAPPPAADATPVDPKRWKWIAFLGLMVAYIVAMTWLGHDRTSDKPALSSTVGGLFAETAMALLIFGVPFGLGLALVRPKGSDLYLTRPIHWLISPLLGAAWSVALRVAIMIPAMLAAMIFILLDPKNGVAKFTGHRPKVENLLDPSALANPLYALICMTWLSFVVAGLREELWRAASIRGLCALSPSGQPSRRMEWIAVVITSGFFGLAHLTQGWIAVGVTGLLGVGLGAIQIVRRSLPEAIIAHGFFDAATFFFLFILQQKELLRKVGMPDNLIDQILQR
jgi:membrane protease YdiL (CAAX protease family)